VEVAPRRREDVDDDRTLGSGNGLVRSARRNAPRCAGAQLAALLSDPELQRAAQENPELLVLVAVLTNDRAGVEFDDRQGDPLPVNGAGDDPVPDLLGRDRGELAERAQRRLPRRKT
jgi:hypothetical protein